MMFPRHPKISTRLPASPACFTCLLHLPKRAGAEGKLTIWISGAKSAKSMQVIN
jgi:hypothetical protein